MVSDTTNFNLGLFFEITPDLLCIAGYDGYFRKINPAVSKLLGYTDEELFSRPINEFIYPEDREITSIHRSNLTRDIPLLNYENRYVKKDGEIVWLAWTSMPNDATKTVYAIAKNITHKKRLEEERISLITNLTGINDDLKQLTYTTSHNLRSPVNNLLMIFSMMDVTKITDIETREFVEVLQNSANSLKIL
jgi:PAS domain S-box-containing protein